MSEQPPTEGHSYACGYCKKPITAGCYCSDACANGDERLGPLPLLLPPERLRYLKAVAKEYMAAGKPNGLVELVAHIEALDMRSPGEPSADQPRDTLLDNSLRQRAHELRRKACSAWSGVIIPPYAGLDEAKCQLAAALEERLRSVIDELADLSMSSGEPSEKQLVPIFEKGQRVSHCELGWPGTVVIVYDTGMLSVQWDHKSRGLISPLRVVALPASPETKVDNHD